MNFRDYKAKLIALKKDNYHGANVVASALFELFSDANYKLTKTEYLKLAGVLKNWQPPMGDVLRAISFIIREAEDDREDLAALISGETTRRQRAIENTVARAAELIKRCRTIATFSSSSLVKQSILKAGLSGWRGQVIIPESRPIFEGRELAKALALAKCRFSIRFSTDCLTLASMADADAVFIGADLIARDCFINKIGTSILPIGLNPQKYLYIVAPSNKFYYHSVEKIIFENMPPAEVWENAPRGITVINRYFEKIKFTKNMRFVSELGCWDKSKLQKYLENESNLA